MFNQKFTYNELNKLIRRGDLRKYFTLDKSKEIDIKKVIKQIEKERLPLIKGFASISSKQNNSKKIYFFRNTPNDYQAVAEDLFLRKANQNIRYAYGVKFSDRYSVIKNTITLLKDYSDFYILRLDIKSFFENIKREKILNRLNQSAILTFETKIILNNLFSNHNIPPTGLPRGLNISSTLAELYLNDFDKKIKKIDDFFYYARFVDDIIIFSKNEIRIDRISKLLPEGLIFNDNKTSRIHLTQNKTETFNFLGYQFKLTLPPKAKEKIKLSISISEDKIKKIKSRIVISFLEYKKDRNFLLLEDRLRFLTSVYEVKTDRQQLEEKNSFDSSLLSGLAYSYSFINDFSCLKNLDQFLIMIIKGKGYFSRYKQNFSCEQTIKLMKCSFFVGFHTKRYVNFSSTRLSRITSCWNNK